SMLGCVFNVNWTMKSWSMSVGIDRVESICFPAVFAKEKTVKAAVGTTATLPCCHKISSSDSLNNYRVYWQTKSQEVVLAYATGTLFEYSRKYNNRTKMNLTSLELVFSPVEVSDKDTYQCIVQEVVTGPQKLCVNTVDLFVVANFSKPVITADVPKDACGSTQVMVNCSSYGGYPNPKVSGILNNMSVDWKTELFGNKTSLYNVTAKLQFNLTEDISLTCTIEYDGYYVSSNYSLEKLKECRLSPIPPTHGIIIASSLVLVCIFLVALALLLKYFQCYACEQLRSSHYPVPHEPAVGTALKEVTSFTSLK
uniref:T-lymphocyte activation antigen CD80-like n=1 Tax=Pelodiscus sinensis TaxID=13735 RepID=K7FUP5_PELSI